MRSKDKRLQSIRENRIDFRLFRRSIKTNFPTSSPRFERNANLIEAQYHEESARDLESKAKTYKSKYESQENNNSLDFFNTLIKESYKLAALGYYQAGIYSVFISDPLTAFKCFKKSAKNYRILAELVKEEPLYGLMLQETNVSKDKAKFVRHEAAYRLARLKGISLGLLGKK